MTLGGVALVAPAWGQMQLINAEATRLEASGADQVDWNKVEEAQQNLDDAAGTFDAGVGLAVTGLAAIAAGMTWGVVEKNRFAEE